MAIDGLKPWRRIPSSRSPEDEGIKSHMTGTFSPAIWGWKFKHTTHFVEILDIVSCWIYYMQSYCKNNSVCCFLLSCQQKAIYGGCARRVLGFCSTKNGFSRSGWCFLVQAKINGHFRNLNWRYLPYVRPFFRPKFSGNITTIHMAWNMVLTYLHQLDPEDLPLIRFQVSHL